MVNSLTNRIVHNHGSTLLTHLICTPPSSYISKIEILLGWLRVVPVAKVAAAGGHRRTGARTRIVAATLKIKSRVH